MESSDGEKGEKNFKTIIKTGQKTVLENLTKYSKQTVIKNI